MTSVESDYVPVVFRLSEAEKDGLFPECLKHFPPSPAFRISDHLTVGLYKNERTKIEEEIGAYEGAFAIGAKAIWETFPSLQGLFVAKVERVRLGQRSISLQHLSNCIFGDTLAAPVLYFIPTNDLRTISKENVERSDHFVVSSDDLQDFEFLVSPPPNFPNIDIDNYELFFVSGLSTDIPSNALNIPGLQLISAHYLENIRQKLLEDLSQFSRPFDETTTEDLIEQALPRLTTLTFMFDRKLPSSSEYCLAIVNRFLALATLSQSPQGKLLTRVRIDSNRGYSMETFGNRSSARNYFIRQETANYHVSRKSSLFHSCLELLSGSNLSKFSSGKEDYRLRSLDTVEDSGKSGVPALITMQIWMAIECLVSQKHEVSQALSLALSAFWSKEHRPNAFLFIQKAYDFRSRVAHGYAFPREEIYSHLTFVQPIFQRLFFTSLKFKSADNLRVALRNHVLEGQPTCFDSAIDFVPLKRESA